MTGTPTTAPKPRLAAKARLRYDEVRQIDLLLLPERVVKLNRSGAAILRLCDGTRTVREIADALGAQYGQANVESDVVEFLMRISGEGWVH